MKCMKLIILSVALYFIQIMMAAAADDEEMFTASVSSSLLDTKVAQEQDDALKSQTSYWIPNMLIGTDFQTQIVERGQTLTNKKPAAYFFGLVSSGPFYAVASWFNVDYGEKDPTRYTDEYAIGWAQRFGNGGFDISATYADSSPSNFSNSWEYGAALDYNITDNLNTKYTYIWSPDYSNTGVYFRNSEVSMRYQLNESWALRAELGYSTFDSEYFANYTYYDLSVIKNFNDRFTVITHYVDSNLGDNCAVRGGCDAQIWIEFQIRTYLNELL